MQDEDIVETSDAEELEEQVAFKSFACSSSRTGQTDKSPLPSPRKRQKLSHISVDSLSRPTSSPHASASGTNAEPSPAPSSPPHWGPMPYPGVGDIDGELPYPLPPPSSPTLPSTSEYPLSDAPMLSPPSSPLPPSYPGDISGSGSLFEPPLIGSQKPPPSGWSIPLVSQALVHPPEALPQYDPSTGIPDISGPDLEHNAPSLREPNQRYALRRREVRQLKPYSLEFAEYKRAMESHPEAIVKTRNPPDRDSREKGILYQDHYREEPCNQASVLDEATGEFGGVLEDLSSTDEDIRALSKETRQAFKHTKDKKKRGKGKIFEVFPLPQPHSPMSPSESNETIPQCKPPSAGQVDSEQAEQQANDGEESLDNVNRRHLRTLKKMYPAGMAMKLVDEPLVKGLRRHNSATPGDQTPGPAELLPGQTKIRRSLRPPSIHQIRGDSESSDSQVSVPDLRSPGRRMAELHPTAVYPHSKAVFELSDTSDDSSGVDDEDIQTYLHSERSTYREDLIDWMLARTRTIGPRKFDSKQKRSRRPYPLDITISRGYRNQGLGSQTLLNFQPKPRNEATTRKHQRRENVEGTSFGTSEVRDSVGPPSISKSNKKNNTSPEPAKNLYIFTAARGTHIVTGKSVRGLMSLDLADQDFCEALSASHSAIGLVQSSHPGKSYPQKSSMHNGGPRTETKRRHELPTSSDIHPNYPLASSSARCYVADIRKYLSGITFPSSTAIARGSLRELMLVLASRSPIARTSLSSCNARGITLHPEMTADEFLGTIPRVYDGIFQMTTELPEEDPVHIQDWWTFQRVFNLYLSWFLCQPTQENATAVRVAATSSTHLLITRMKDEIQGSPLADESIMLACWFTVELAIRLSDLSSHGPSDLVQSGLSLLLQALLSYDLRAIVESVADEVSLSRSSSHYAAEIWVYVIHITNHFSSTNLGGTKPHLLCGLIQDTLHDNLQNIEGSEKLWGVIHGLTALSQFSVNGMTTTKTTLSGCWDLVTRALQCVRLLADTCLDEHLSIASLDKRDQYAGLIVRRCYELHTYWGWSVDEGSAMPMFRYLMDVFRSRKFANLRHEPADFPEFMLRNNWDLIYEENSSDTAYMLFWKLLVRALRPTSPDNAQLGIVPKLGKLLSSSLPVGSLHFSRNSPPSVHDLSMLFNRLSAMAIAIYLESKPTHRVIQARSYVDFSIADDTTRSAVIRGMMNFAIFLVNRKMGLPEIASWIGEMAKSLVKDYDNILQCSNGQPPTVLIQQNRISLSIQLLLGSIRKIFDAQAMAGEYPDSELLLNLETILRHRPITQSLKTALEMRRLCRSLLDARIAVVSPVQPDAPLMPGDNQESQEDFQVDVDLSDPAILAALDEVAQSNFRQLDEKLCHVIKNTNISWLTWEMVRSVAETPPQVNYANRAEEVDSWISCWLGIAAIQVNTNKMTWESCLKLPAAGWVKLEIEWHRRLHLGTMLCLLKLDPTRYSNYRNASFEALITSFLAKEITKENDYLSTWVSVDKYQHPLVRETPSLRNLNTDTISQAMFLELRQPFLSSIIATLNERLRQENGNSALSASNADYISLCIQFFKVMQYNIEVPTQSEEQERYLTWCRQVFQVLNRYLEVKSHPRLTYWMNWGKTLSVS